ncbi:MAG: 4Fe-4S ferredoxin, partial [Clostridia bacterium]
GAISMVPDELPPQQPKASAVVNAMRTLAKSKNEQERIATALPSKLAVAVEKSNRLMAEDLLREAGYMLPQSANAHQLLTELLLKPQAEGFPKQAVEKLLELL